MTVTTLTTSLMERLITRSQGLATPFLLIDLERVRANYRALRRAFENASIHYAVKANSHPAILRTLADDGCGFEISSDGELDQLETLGCPVSFLSSNPIKTDRFVARAAKASAEGFAIDSPEEVA